MNMNGMEMDSVEMAGGIAEQHMTGTRMGHVIPATFFILFATFFLSLAFQRLSQVSSTAEFCKKHIPESNLSLLRKVSLLGIASCIAGMLGEWFGDALVTHIPIPNFFWAAGHQALYALFLFAGVCGLLESYRYAPKDTLRIALVVAFSGQSLLMNQHASMKVDKSDQAVHQLWAHTCLFAAISFAASVYNTESIMPFILGFCFVLWQGIWVLTAAYNWGHHMEMEMVMCIFILEGLAIGLGLVLAMSHFHRKWGGDDDDGDDDNNKSYQPIDNTTNSASADDDEDDHATDDSSEDADQERLNFV